MMEVIVKKHSDSRRFTPHLNRELGKYYHSSKEYVSDMKRIGVEPYRGEVKKYSPKPYERSDWGREMLNDIKSRNGRKPEDRFISELEKKGYSSKTAEKAMSIAKEIR